MATLTYKARDRSGKLVENSIDDGDLAKLRAKLSAEGLFLVSYKILGSNKSNLELPEFLQKSPKPKDVANLTRQFEVMFNVGLPMDKILLILAEQTQHKKLKAALFEIQKDVATGTKLSAAFSKFPNVFPQLYTSMLEVGESGGVLGQALHELASVLQKDHGLKAKIKSAMLYPKIVVGALVGVMCVMLIFVFPPFKTFYSSNDAELPLPTLIVMAMSDTLIDYWYILIMAGIGFFVAWKYIKKIKFVEEMLAKLAFKIPVFGKLNLLAANSRFGHLIASLYKAGVPLQSGLGVVANTMSNVLYAREILFLKTSLEEGESISKGMASCKYFEPMVVQTCSIGEQTGQLGEVLEATTNFYDEEIEDMLKNLTTLIEPILLFFLFGSVLLLALAVYMPIWGISDVVLN